MESKKASNWEHLQRALDLFEKYMGTCTAAKTAFGIQNPQKGYQIRYIRINETWVRIEAYLLDRKIAKNDEHVREGDTAYFVVKENGVEEE